jgi:hypothetical protein
MSKTFAQIPKPAALSPSAIAAYERGGIGSDTVTHIPPKVGKVEAEDAAKVEPTRRLSLDLPASWHRRFKTACSRTDRKMLAEILEFIKRRTVELEQD